MYKTTDLYDLTHTKAEEYLKNLQYPWLAFSGLSRFIIELGATLSADYVKIGDNVWVHKTSPVAPTAYIGAPAIIGAGSEVRHCAFIRGSALVGEGCVVGNSTELKNVILFDRVQVPHYNYVGDSILGYGAHLGAGAITSNVKSDKTPVVVHGDKDYPTGLKKLGAMVGDFAEIGCNSVLNPGTVVGRGAQIYPLSCVRGYIPEGCIYKGSGNIVKKD